MANWETILETDNFIVVYDKANAKYRVSCFEDYHFVDDVMFDALILLGMFYSFRTWEEPFVDEESNEKVQICRYEILNTSIFPFNVEECQRLFKKICSLNYNGELFHIENNAGLVFCLLFLFPFYFLYSANSAAPITPEKSPNCAFSNFILTAGVGSALIFAISVECL